MLEVQNIKFSYDKSREFKYNFRLAQGEILLIGGKSGAGKSTLLNILSGLLKPKSGKILFNSENIGILEPWQRPVSALFQNNNLFAHLSVEQNILLGASPNLKPIKRQAQKIDEVLNLVDLDLSFKKALPQDLSGGQQQRVALARSLISEKKILLLDEPFNGLDKDLRKKISADLINIVQKQGLYVLFVSHHLEQMPSNLNIYNIN